MLLDILILFAGAALLALEHSVIRHTPNLVRYSAGTAVLVGMMVSLLVVHGGGGFWWVPVVAAGTGGLAVGATFAWDGGRDVLHIIQTEGVPTWARLVALYRRSQTGGR